MVETSRHLRSRLRRAAEAFPYLRRALALVWRAAPRWTAAWAVLLAVQGLLPVATVYLTRWLVDALVPASADTAADGPAAALELSAGAADVRAVIVPAVLMGLVLLASQLLRGVSGWVSVNQSERVRDAMAGLVHEKSADLDMSFYESPEYYDRLHRARMEAGYRPLSLLQNLGALLQSTVTLAAMALVLVPYGFWLPVALVASTLPALYVVLHHRLRLHQWRLRTTADERRSWYVDWLLTAREAVAENRLFGLSGHFRATYQAVRGRLRRERLDLARDQARAESIAGACALLVTFGAMIVMLGQTLAGSITLGQLALVFQAFNQGQGLLRTVLENLGEIYTNSLFLSDLFEFLGLEPRVARPVAPAPVPSSPSAGLSFDAVTFGYPGAAFPAVDALCLDVPAGSVVAIVGANGAGKSTLLKLICRLYDPDAGAIRLDGTDIRAFDPDQYRRLVTVLFQEPVQYSATAAENIALGDLGAMGDRQAIEAAAIDAGADVPIARLPHGYDTLLGRWFDDGHDLSVGEWQRIALARAFLRRAPVLVLDEPTSAMDAWAESDWLVRFRELARGRTALLVTHRFTTARMADVIHVMEQGRIVESGSHDELVALGARYADGWARQVERRPSSRR